MEEDGKSETKEGKVEERESKQRYQLNESDVRKRRAKALAEEDGTVKSETRTQRQKKTAASRHFFFFKPASLSTFHLYSLIFLSIFYM